jgi:hypothetical protein
MPEDGRKQVKGNFQTGDVGGKHRVGRKSSQWLSNGHITEPWLSSTATTPNINQTEAKNNPTALSVMNAKVWLVMHCQTTKNGAI